MTFRLFALLSCGAVLAAQTPILPLSEVRQGMRGVGKTIFQGDRIEEFQAEILGVLENAGPKQSIILARLSGGPLERSGVLQGMSGSPVYVNGRLMGAVALSFAFSKDPIAGIRPIEEMLRVGSGGRALNVAKLEDLVAKPYEMGGGSRLIEVATPLSLSGFTASTIEHFAPQLRALGLEPMQGTLGGGAATGNRPAAGKRLEPGSMISVQLVSGDLNVAADGTVTHLDGNRIYAFGHRFLAVGPTSLPFSRSEVLTLLPNLNTSFKISAAKEWVGSITGDYSAAVAGEVGRHASLVPVTLAVNGKQNYKFNLVEDRLLTPFFLQMAMYSAIEATERTAGSGTVAVRGAIEFVSGQRVRVDNIYSSDNGAPLPSSLAASIPLSYAMQSGYPEFKVKNLDLRVETDDNKRQYYVDQFWTSRSTVKPGEAVDLHVTLSGQGGVEVKRSVTWRVPIGAAIGTLQLTATDAMSTNVADYSHILTQAPNKSAQISSMLNGLRSNDTITIRVWKSESSYLVQGQSLPSPPPSLALLLKRTPGAAAPGASSKLAEFDFKVDAPITGSRIVQLEVKE